MAELKGKVALVTGAGRGIGFAIADTMAREGADVVIFDLCPEEAGLAAAEQIAQAHGVKAAFYRCDVSSFDTVQETVKAVIKEFGGVDILVNNAGIIRDKVLLAMSEQDWDMVLDVQHYQGLLPQLYEEEERQDHQHLLRLRSHGQRCSGQLHLG